MHTPLSSTPLIANRRRATAVCLSACLAGIVFFSGCKKPMEKADAKNSDSVKADEASLHDELSRLNFYHRAREAYAGPEPTAEVNIGTKAQPKMVAAYPPLEKLDNLEKVASNDLAVTLKDLDAAAKATGVSAPVRSAANMAAGYGESALADQTIIKVRAAELRLQRQIARVNQLSGQIQLNNVIIAGLNDKDAKTKVVLAAVDKTTADATTGLQAIWVPGDAGNAPIQALEGVKKAVADLTAQLQALEDQKATLIQQRAAALKQAEALNAQSEQVRGQQSVDLYVKAANFRKTARDLSTKIQDLGSVGAPGAEMPAATTQPAPAAASPDSLPSGKISIVKHELDVATAKQAQLQAALKQFAGEKDQIDQGAKDVQTRIAEVTAQSKIILDGDPAAAPTTSPAIGEVPASSIAGAAAKIDDISKELDKLRAEADAHIKKADEYFAAAGKSNSEIRAENQKYLTTADPLSPSKPAWQWMIELHSQADPDLQRALLLQRSAGLNADIAWYSAQQADAEAHLKAVLTTAGLTVPPALEHPDLAAKAVAAKKDAAAAFTQIETSLDEIINRNPGSSEPLKSLQQSASGIRLIETYSHYAFLHDTGDIGADAADKAAAKASADALLATAKDSAIKLAGDPATAIPLPLPLPPEIAPPPPIATAGASTQPSDAGAPGAVAAADSPDQAAVRAVSVGFIQALLAGDGDKARTLTIPDPKTNEGIDAVVALVKAVNKLNASVTTKFGPGGALVANAVQNNLQQMMQKPSTLPIVVNGDTATQSEGSADPDPNTFKKVDGAWKVTPPSDNPKNNAQIAGLKNFAAALDQISADVDSGKIATLAALAPAVAQAAAQSGIPIPAAPAAPGVPAAPAPGIPAAPGVPAAPAPGTPTPATPAPATPTPAPAAPETPAPATPPAPGTPAPATPPPAAPNTPAPGIPAAPAAPTPPPAK